MFMFRSKDGKEGFHSQGSVSTAKITQFMISEEQSEMQVLNKIFFCGAFYCFYVHIWTHLCSIIHL